MSNENNRRKFLKRSVTVGTALSIGGIGLAGCCKHFCNRAKSTANSDIDFSRSHTAVSTVTSAPYTKLQLKTITKLKLKQLKNGATSKGQISNSKNSTATAVRIKEAKESRDRIVLFGIVILKEVTLLVHNAPTSKPAMINCGRIIQVCVIGFVILKLNLD